MTRVSVPFDRALRAGRYLAAVIVAGLGFAQLQSAHAAADIFQQAVNYVFTGEVAPQDAPRIVDRQACVIVMRDRKYNRYIRYRLTRFKMDTALFTKKYSGSEPSYELDVKGDSVILEYLSPDQKSVAQAYRSAQIPLPGDIDQTRKALDIVFGQFCKPEKPAGPFR